MCRGTPCGSENPDAAARLRMNASRGLFDDTPALFLAFGALVELGRVTLGAAYVTRPLSSDSGTVIMRLDRTSVDLPPVDGGGNLCLGLDDPSVPEDGCVSAELSYRLPDMITFGAKVRVGKTWDVVTTLRALNLAAHDKIQFRLIGPAARRLSTTGIPENLPLHRGFKSTIDLRTYLEHRPMSWLRWGAGFRIETSAVPKRNLSPGTIDGFKFGPLGMVSIKRRGLEIGVGAAATFMLPRDTETDSLYDPTAVSGCASQQGDIDAQPCRVLRVGAARPTAAGRYNRFALTFSVNTGYAF